MKNLNETILVVEDEQGMRVFYKGFFKIRGCETECVRSVTEAIEYIEKNPISLVVLDLVLPCRNGEEFFDYLEQNHPDVFIIVATGHPTPSILRKIAAKSNSCLFVKPFNIDEICEEAIAVVSQSRAQAIAC